MGRMTLEGSALTGDITWKVVEDPVGYTDNSSLTFGPWKETKLIVAGTETASFVYLTVPNPWSTADPRKFGVSQKGVKPNDAGTGTIPASEGSPGFFTTAQWYGSQKYKINYVESGGGTTIGNESGQGTASTMSILVHVQQRASQLYLYRIDNPTNFTQPAQAKGWFLDSVGKSSTVDMMADGTIVVAAEKGGQDKNYFIRLLRYSQKYITEQTSSK